MRGCKRVRGCNGCMTDPHSPSPFFVTMTLCNSPVNKPANKLQSSSPTTASRGCQVLMLLPPKTAEENVVVAGLIARHPAAVQVLYQQYSGLVGRVLTQVLGNDRDVEDLTQDTLITVIQRAAAVRNAYSLRSFVIGVAIRLAKNEIRKRRVRRFVGFDEAMSNVPAEAYDAVTVQRVRHLYRALDRLEVNIRMAFILRFVHGCELAETAEACGCSLATIKRKLQRAEARFTALAEADPVLRDLLQSREGTA